MDERQPHGFLSLYADPYAIILGTNEIASAIAVHLCWARFRVVMSDDPYPPVIRRGMAFHDALYDDRAEVDGIVGRRVESALEIVDALAWPGRVAVTHLQFTDLITLRTPAIVVDARMQKHRVTPDLRGVARLAIGVGPKFTVERNCDIAVETLPAKTGALVAAGETAAPTASRARSAASAVNVSFIRRTRAYGAPRSTSARLSSRDLCSAIWTAWL
jgi:hypothetical protein